MLGNRFGVTTIVVKRNTIPPVRKTQKVFGRKPVRVAAMATMDDIACSFFRPYQN